MGDFEGIVGQDTAKRFIRTALEKGSLYNILLAGPKGVGKRMFGFALAKAIGCPPHSHNFHLIGPVPSRLYKHMENDMGKIIEYMKTYLPEHGIIDIEGKESIHIKQIQHLISWLVLMPLAGKHRVVLIIEADRMTQDAANCFLKTLEEPPVDTLIVLTSSRPDDLLPTIRSRCQVVPLNYLNSGQIREIVFDSDDSFALGSPGDIMRIRESELFENTLEVFRKTPLDDRQAVKLARELERKNLSEFFFQLMLLYRQVLYCKLGIRPDIAYEEDIVAKTNAITYEDALLMIAELNNSINNLDQNAHHLLLIANTLLKLC